MIVEILIFHYSVGEKKEFFILAESTRADKGSTDI